VIAYFDTSALLPLFINEPSTDRCTRLWNEASRVVSVRLLYPEARASIARAERMGRVTRAQHAAAIAELDAIIAEVDHIELTADLATSAGELAHTHGLRGYDAVHLAAASTVADSDLIVVTGDADLAAAATSLGIAVALTTA
jgi:predicted nucleic acid-binding protein